MTRAVISAIVLALGATHALAQPVSVMGRGQSAETVTLAGGIAVFTLQSGPTGIFSVSLLNEDGDVVELLANDLGQFDGSKATRIDQAGEYMLQVNCDNDCQWVISVDQQVPADAPPFTAVAASGDKATPYFRLKKGLVVFKLRTDHQAGVFSVFLLDARGNPIDLLANDLAPFDGSKAVKVPENGIYLLSVAADGDWEISRK